ncbi:MAG: hypothetical protein MK212_14875, partial [Saprospiraceae bacterium]|nr:hypothetical protein [Saprospiraceae bacterium]
MKNLSFYNLLVIFMLFACSQSPTTSSDKATNNIDTGLIEQDSLPYYDIITKSCSKRDGLAMSSYERWQSFVQDNKLH